MRDDICPVSASADTDAPYQRMHKQLICKQKKLRFLISRNFLYQTFFFTMKLLIQSSFLPLQPSAKWLLQKKKKSLSSNSGLLSETAVVESAGKYNICFMVFQLTWGNPARVLSNSVVWLDSSNCSEKCVQGQWIYSTDSMTANEDSNQQDFKPCRILDPMCYHASEPRQWCVREDTDHLEKLVSVYQKQQSLYNPQTELKLNFFFRDS